MSLHPGTNMIAQVNLNSKILTAPQHLANFQCKWWESCINLIRKRKIFSRSQVKCAIVSLLQHNSTETLLQVVFPVFKRITWTFKVVWTLVLSILLSKQLYAVQNAITNLHTQGQTPLLSKPECKRLPQKCCGRKLSHGKGHVVIPLTLAIGTRWLRDTEGHCYPDTLGWWHRPTGCPWHFPRLIHAFTAISPLHRLPSLPTAREWRNLLMFYEGNSLKVSFLYKYEIALIQIYNTIHFREVFGSWPHISAVWQEGAMQAKHKSWKERVHHRQCWSLQKPPEMTKLRLH